MSSLLQSKDSALPPTTSRTSAKLLVAGIGGSVGFVLGTVMLALLQINAPGGFHWSIDVPFSAMFGGTFGFVVGAFGASALAWGFLRHVPLGRLIAWTTLATIAGYVGGVFAGHPVVGGCLGLVSGVVALRATHRRATA